MSESQILHRQAMALLHEADVAQIFGDEAKANEKRRQAFGLEKEAALLLADRSDLEPTRSVIYKSAAAIALECGLAADAKELAQMALAGSSPDYVTDQLENILRKARE